MTTVLIEVFGVFLVIFGSCTVIQVHDNSSGYFLASIGTFILISIILNDQHKNSSREKFVILVIDIILAAVFLALTVISFTHAKLTSHFLIDQFEELRAGSKNEPFRWVLAKMENLFGCCRVQNVVSR
jgi:hypothetical protein